MAARTTATLVIQHTDAHIPLAYTYLRDLATQVVVAVNHIDTLEAELRTKNDELHTLRFIGQTPEHLDVQPGALQIVPGPPTLIQRIKAAIAAFKGNHATRQTNPQI